MTSNSTRTNGTPPNRRFLVCSPLAYLQCGARFETKQANTCAVHALSGSLAGFAEHTLVFPFDVWKTYRQADVGQKPLRVVLREEGYMRLWRGTSTMLIGSVPAHAGYFSIYEFGKVQFGANGPNHTPFAAGLSGALGTVFHDLIMTPMDVVKQRMQLGFHSGVGDALRSVVNTQGMYGLYRSFPVALSMNIPFASVNVAANESFKRVLNPSGEHSIPLSLVCGALAGGVAGALTTPLDVIRTRIQTQSLHPSHFRPENGNNKASLMRSAPRRSMGPFVLQSVSAQRNNVAYVASRAKYTRPTRCPLPIALWAMAPGSSTLVQPGSKFDAGRRSNQPPVVTATATATATTTTTARSAPKGVMDTVKSIWLKEGVKGYWRGTSQRVMVQAPAVAISWATYETAKEVLVPVIDSGPY